MRQPQIVADTPRNEAAVASLVLCYHASVYVNFLMEEGQERISQAYGARRYERLKALKRTYDPTNLFRLNQNIPPEWGVRLLSPPAVMGCRR